MKSCLAKCRRKSPNPTEDTSDKPKKKGMRRRSTLHRWTTYWETISNGVGRHCGTSWPILDYHHKSITDLPGRSYPIMSFLTPPFCLPVLYKSIREGRILIPAACLVHLYYEICDFEHTKDLNFSWCVSNRLTWIIPQCLPVAPKSMSSYQCKSILDAEIPGQ